MIAPSSLAIILQGTPFPGATFTVTPGGAALDLVINGVTITFCEGAWFAADRHTTPAHLSFAATPTAEQVHAEIARVLALVKAPAEAPLVIGGGPTVDIPRTAIESIVEHVGAESWTLDEVTDKVASMQDRITDEIDRRKDVEAQLAKMTDAHAVVSQRLVGAQKEVAELVGKVGEATARADKVEDRLRRDDDLRSAIAVAVGLDGSASPALILDTVTRDRPGREISRLSGLLDVLAAPVAFGERHLSIAERAEWALRRWLAEGKECSARMAQLIEAEVCLDVLGVPAYAAVPSDDPGDASEALTVAERLRLHFGARS